MLALPLLPTARLWCADMRVLLDVEPVGLSARMGLASAHAQLRWLLVPLTLVALLPVPVPAPLPPSGAESQ